MRRGTHVMSVVLITIAAWEWSTVAPAGAATPANADHPAASPGAPDLAEFLVRPAENALATRDLAHAVSLWRGVVAIRGDADEAVFQLATAWTLAGDFGAAAEELERFAHATSDEAARARATAQIDDLRHRPRGFTAPGQVFAPLAVEEWAREADRLGKKHLGDKDFTGAAALFRGAVEMAPESPAGYSDLALAYEKLGNAEAATPLFLRALRLHPFGRNADEVRAKLASQGALGKLSVTTSFPCEQLWVNRQPVFAADAGKRAGKSDGVQPIHDLAVAPGRYRLLCYNEKYHFARYVDVDVARGEAQTADFAWAVVENKLDPWGRIVVENPDRQNELDDVGLWEEIGLPVPDDHRALKVVLTSGDGARHKEVLLKLEPGRRVPLAW